MTSYKSNSVKIGSAVLARELSKNRVTKKRKKGKKTKKSRESDISPSCRDAPTGAIAVIFGVRGDIADIITHTKFYVNRLRGFGILTPPILPFSIGLAGRPYNSVSTTVLHCDDQTRTFYANGGMSSSIPVTCSIPQGSVLGPILFISYTDDVSLVFKKHQDNHHLYTNNKHAYVSKPVCQQCVTGTSCPSTLFQQHGTHHVGSSSMLP